MKEEIIRTGRNREVTETVILQAVGELVESGGFESLGINAIAAKSGVSKMLIYRYFGSLDGLIAAYIRQYDFWINFDQEFPAGAGLNAFVKKMYREQIRQLRDNYTLRRLYRWELLTDNPLVSELRERREAAGLQLVDTISRLSKHSRKDVAFLATLINTSISYLMLLEENCPAYNGIRIQEESGWSQLEEGIDKLIDNWIKK